MSRLKPTSPQEALRQLQAAKSRPFFKRPHARLSIACVLLFILIGVMQTRFKSTEKNVPDPELANELMKNPITSSNLKTPAAYYTRARVYLEHGRPAEAISDYNHVIKKSPTALQAYKGRAQVFLRVKKYGAALADFEKVLSLNPTPEIQREVLNNRGLIKMQWGKYKSAIADYLAAIQANAPLQQKALFYSNIGLAYEALNDNKKAHIAYQAAQNSSGLYTLAYLFEGRLYVKENKIQSAVPLLQKVTQDRPDLSEGWWLSGEVASTRNLKENAQKAYSNACKLGHKKACKKVTS